MKIYIKEKTVAEKGGINADIPLPEKPSTNRFTPVRIMSVGKSSMKLKTCVIRVKTMLKIA